MALWLTRSITRAGPYIHTHIHAYIHSTNSGSCKNQISTKLMKETSLFLPAKNFILDAFVAVFLPTFMPILWNPLPDVDSWSQTLVHNFHNSLFLTCCTSSFSASTNGTNDPGQLCTRRPGSCNYLPNTLREFMHNPVT